MSIFFCYFSQTLDLNFTNKIFSERCQLYLYSVINHIKTSRWNHNQSSISQMYNPFLVVKCKLIFLNLIRKASYYHRTQLIYKFYEFLFLGTLYALIHFLKEFLLTYRLPIACSRPDISFHKEIRHIDLKIYIFKTKWISENTHIHQSSIPSIVKVIMYLISIKT